MWTFLFLMACSNPDTDGVADSGLLAGDDNALSFAPYSADGAVVARESVASLEASRDFLPSLRRIEIPFDGPGPHSVVLVPRPDANDLESRNDRLQLEPTPHYPVVR